MTLEEYAQMLNDIDLDCLDEDLKALHFGREWQKNFTERSINVQIVRLLRHMIEELQQCNNGRSNGC